MRTVRLAFVLLFCALGYSAEARSEKLVRFRLEPRETIHHFMLRKNIDLGFYNDIAEYNSNLSRFNRSKRVRIAFPEKFLHARPSKRQFRRSADLLTRYGREIPWQKKAVEPEWVAKRRATPPENVDYSATMTAGLPEDMGAVTITEVAVPEQTEVALLPPAVTITEVTAEAEASIPAPEPQGNGRAWLVFFLGNGSMGTVWFLSWLASKQGLLTKFLQLCRSS